MEINSAHAQISETAKIASAIVSLCPLTFFDKLYELYFKWMRGFFLKGKELTFYGIRKYLDIPYITGHIITKVERIDLVGEGDIDLFPLRK